MIANKDNANFLTFINAICERPGMYQISKVEDIGLLIFGYKSGLLSCSDQYETVSNLISQFNEFINKEFTTNEEIDWVRLIRFHGNGDKNSLDLFKEKFKRFISNYNIN